LAANLMRLGLKYQGDIVNGVLYVSQARGRRLANGQVAAASTIARPGSRLIRRWPSLTINLHARA
jgi:hypothetical protein